MNEDLIQRLEDLREQWALHAHALERIHDQRHPAVKAYRCCIEDLYLAMNPESLDVGTVQQTLSSPLGG